MNDLLHDIFRALGGLYRHMVDLLKPRTIFAGMFYGTFCWLILQGKEIPECLIVVVSSLMTYYYTKKMLKGGTDDSSGKHY